MTQELPQETPAQLLREVESAKAALEEHYEELEDLFRDLRDLTNQLEPGMLVERDWTVERDRLLKAFMRLTGPRAIAGEDV